MDEGLFKSGLVRAGLLFAVLCLFMHGCGVIGFTATQIDRRLFPKKPQPPTTIPKHADSFDA